MAIAKPPAVVPVVLRFNYKGEAHAVCELSQHARCWFRSHNDFTAHTLRYIVTLTFDPVTLNVCNVSAVMLRTEH